VGHQGAQAAQIEGLGGGGRVEAKVPAAGALPVALGGQDVGAHGPAVGLHVLRVLLGADAQDGLTEVLLRRQQEGARQQDHDGALRVQCEDWIVYAYRLQAQILGEGFHGCIHCALPEDYDLFRSLKLLVWLYYLLLAVRNYV